MDDGRATAVKHVAVMKQQSQSTREKLKSIKALTASILRAKIGEIQVYNQAQSTAGLRSETFVCGEGASMTKDLLDGDLLKRACMGGNGEACSCSLGVCRSWESFTEDRWPTKFLRQIGTLRDPAVDEPTLEEWHPRGTRYASSDAPIAAAFFPYNRCDAYACNRCKRTLLRYTEYGGYYVDHRVREVLPELIV